MKRVKELSEAINRIVVSMLNSISPALARLYIANYLVRINILFWGFMPITFLLFLVFGGTIFSWIPAVWISSTLIAVVQGKGHSASSSHTTQDLNSVTPPSAPPSNPQPQGTIVTCKACGGTGFIDTGDEPVQCTRCRGYGKLRLIPRGDAPPIIGTKKSSSGKWQLDDKSLRLLSIIVGVVILAVGSRIPVVGNYIALGGVGILVVGLVMFKPKPKVTVT